jgi:subtilisin-like proprotein convertase family protein
MELDDKMTTVLYWGDVPMRASLFLWAGLATALPALGLTEKADKKDFCFPENNLDAEDGFFLVDSGINEAKFNETIDRVASFYHGIVAAHNGALSFDRRWTDSTVNASARQDGSTWLVSMYGGLARRPEVTEDGFALVVCHELGHHLGGFPFKGERWAASEGQADYFASQACVRKIWADDLEKNATFRGTVPPYAEAQCNQAFSTTAEQNLCYRTAMAGKSLASLLASIGHAAEPHFETPDMRKVTQTSDTHPAAQCRMDTYLSGAVCTKTFPEMTIPGRLSADGQSSIKAEGSASQVSCTDATMISLGRRPRCWYAPKLSLNVDVAHMTKVEVRGNGNSSWDPGETFGINIPLANNLPNAISGATLSIGGFAPGITVDYPTIQAGSSSLATVHIEGQVPETLRCGERFSLRPLVKVGLWQDQSTLNFEFGHHVSEEQVADRTSVSIPDNDPIGLSQTLRGVSAKSTDLIKASINLTHNNIGDLKIVLKSPSGHEFIIQNRQGGSGTSIVKTFDVEVTNEPIAGAWTLNVSDLSSNDIGTVNSWGLEFTTTSCDSGIQLTVDNL